MDLRTYLFHKRMRISDFADSIDYGRVYVGQVVNGRKKPGRKMAEAITKATRGDVTLEELMKDLLPKNNEKGA
jgi:DNA-binding transcriptional regulator YdaS (Cro superfamily)